MTERQLTSKVCQNFMALSMAFCGELGNPGYHWDTQISQIMALG